MSREVAERVMHAATPTWCVKAAIWAAHARADLEAPYVNGRMNRIQRKVSDLEALFGVTDVLDCLLYGAGGAGGFGKARRERALRVLGIEPPDTRSASELFAILRGAREVIVGMAQPIRSTDPLSLKTRECDEWRRSGKKVI